MLETIARFWLKQSNYNTALAVYASFPFLMVPALMIVNAPYGRFSGKFVFDWSLRGKWSWCLMEIVSPITFISSLYFARPSWTPYQVVLTSAWVIHYINRSLVYPYRAHSLSPIHVLAFSCSVLFNTINGYTNGLWIGRHTQPVDSLFCAGLALWTAGFLSNMYHDLLLFRLRKNKTQRYFIPQGALFNYVSCPNYFSELVEWVGFAMATGHSTPALLFVLSTAANLMPRAWKTHAWYRQQFQDNYPKQRKAVIPYLL
ncbi:3-oxo-5-alpha-steroid 4-dehydrogenase-domain-containing protein [Sporodiniella umbellata]|nr:3-oxo-5-alpha-steroid 4-dehydrogenase-domain-containing protein [Sporodiniella umbellata]